MRIGIVVLRSKRRHTTNADDYLQKTIRQTELVHGDDARRHGQEDAQEPVGVHRLPPDEAGHLMRKSKSNQRKETGESVTPSPAIQPSIS